jgi:hypothetical protein
MKCRRQTTGRRPASGSGSTGWGRRLRAREAPDSRGNERAGELPGSPSCAALARRLDYIETYSAVI